MRRVAKVLGQQGDAGLAKPTAFVVFACSKPVLISSVATLDRLVSGGKRIAWFEGDLATLASREGDVGKLRERQYIVKVSTFNNADPAARERDLHAIDGVVEKAADRYRPEVALSVGWAVGARRPDEVLLMYYETDQAGDRFRKGNPDLMSRIDQFNSRHVSSFVYYLAKAWE